MKSESMNPLIKKAILLSWFTVIYNLLEGIISIAFGIGDDSVALAGFGVDSLIEVASAILILWRFRIESLPDSCISTSPERKATFGIGILFLILTFMTVGASFLQLKSFSHPVTTKPGLIISLISLSFMFFLWASKSKLAKQLDSASMQMDAQCSLSCIKLSGILLVGNLLFTVVPSLWWVDSMAAIFIGLMIGKEGWDTVKAARHPEFSGGCGCSCSGKVSSTSI